MGSIVPIVPGKIQLKQFFCTPGVQLNLEGNIFTEVAMIQARYSKGHGSGRGEGQ